MSGEYRLCWCQASSRPCSYPADFNFDVGKLQIVAAAYVGALAAFKEAAEVWPLCSFQAVVFTTWREWQTFDDCCCNYNEAGGALRKRQRSVFGLISDLFSSLETTLRRGGMQGHAVLHLQALLGRLLKRSFHLFSSQTRL